MVVGFTSGTHKDASKRPQRRCTHADRRRVGNLKDRLRWSSKGRKLIQILAQAGKSETWPPHQSSPITAARTAAAVRLPAPSLAQAERAW